MKNTKGIKAFLHDAKAVSPAIATLILIVVAAVAAAGIGLIVQSSQGNSGKTLNEKNADVQGLISIKGSTTVLPVSQLAAVGFMAEFPSYKISAAGGGSGAGRMLVFTKAVDIGASSDPWPTEEKTQDGIKVPARKDAIIQEAGPDATVWETKIGTGMIVVAANIKNQTSGKLEENIQIVNETTTQDLLTTDAGGIAIRYSTLKAAYNGGAPLTIDGNPVTVVQRSDPGGSEEVFAKWIKEDANGGYLPESPAVGEQGNQGIRDRIASNEHSLGFVDIGYTKGQANGKDTVVAVKIYDGVKTYKADKDTKGLNGDYDKASKAVAGTYASPEKNGLARDLYYYSYGVPKGAVKMYLDYIVSAAGQEHVKKAGFFSI